MFPELIPPQRKQQAPLFRGHVIFLDCEHNGALLVGSVDEADKLFWHARAVIDGPEMRSWLLLARSFGHAAIMAQRKQAG